MGTEITIEEIRSEVLRKIGRNVVLFQQLEGLMKGLAAMQEISASASTWAQAHNEQRAKIDGHTMGQVVGQLKNQLYVVTTDAEAGNTPEEISEPWLSFSFRIESDAAFVDSRNKSLSDLVEARNNLIHKLLPRWNPDSVESCKDLEAFLEEQVTSIRTEISHFKSMIQAIRDHSAELKEFVDSDAGKKAFDLMWLQQSRIVLMLGDIAGQEARSDGWTYLSTAGHILKRKAPEEYAALESLYGHKRLLDLVLAAQLFEVAKEQKFDGATRYLYRISPDWSLQVGGSG